MLCTCRCPGCTCRCLDAGDEGVPFTRRGIADALVEAAHELLEQRDATQLGLFTFADSPLHISFRRWVVGPHPCP
jgi:hypothetical protein